MKNTSILLLIFCSLICSLSQHACQPAEEHVKEKKETGDEGKLPPDILLKDYRPVSIYNLPVTEPGRAMFTAIDIHSHPYPKTIEDLNRWVKNMNEANIEKTVILSYAHGERFDSLVDLYSDYPGHFELWCGIDYSAYESPDFTRKAIAELKRCREKGAGGVGELGDKGKGLFYSKPPAWDMHSDDPRMDPIFEKCAELNMPVNIHVGEPKWMYEKMDSTNDGLMNAFKWRLDNRSGIVDHQGMINILENTLRKHPGTIFIACHLANCCYHLDIADRLLDQYPNLFVDISARYAEFSATPRRTAAFFKKYADRIFYGTDMGMDLEMYRYTFRLLETADEHIYHDYNSYHWPLHGLALPDEILEKIYRKNAERILWTD